ncbi:hypothetical protein AS888_08825 [Peribacillus simplex]|uniref:Uncharacterized protein n=1 Tax=Peribacillus simplex TaxID=1478 RepID=A0A125QR91_9BACI|nr:hypothetical protein AS888_08825 [Peribacillus simplex]
MKFASKNARFQGHDPNSRVNAPNSRINIQMVGSLSFFWLNVLSGIRDSNKEAAGIGMVNVLQCGRHLVRHAYVP